MPVHYHPIQMPASRWRVATLNAAELNRLLALAITTEDECLSHGLFGNNWDFIVYYDGSCYGGTFK